MGLEICQNIIFGLRADHFSKHLLGLENNKADMKMINKDIPKTK